MEDIRRDVVERRCRVQEREVDGLVDAVHNTTRALSQTLGRGHGHANAHCVPCVATYTYCMKQWTKQ